MDRHADQLVGSLFRILGSQGHHEAQRLLVETYQSHAPSDRDELVDRLAADLVTILQEHLTPREGAAVLTTTVEYLVNRFVSVVDVAPVAIVVLDEDGGIQLWNDGAERTFGWSEREVLSKPYARVVAEPSESIPPVSELEDGERLTGVETRHRHKDGSLLDVRLWGAPLYNHEGQFTGATFVISDITERKQREQRLTVLNRALRHNIRHDVTVIRGHLDLLSEEIPESDHLEVIDERVANISNLSEAARNIERLGEPDDSAPATFDLGPELREHAARLRRDWPDARVDVDVPESLPVAAHELLPYGLDNLLENAVEHNDADDPRVRIEARKPDDSSAGVRLVIADNGPGLPTNEREVLRNGTETDLTHSTGVGLWLTQWIVRSSGGQLDVETSEWDGTRVTVELQSA
ncbi:PAS domain S-box protein [Halobellus rubicundus]|uniref:PAS domain S-box protein n=1 Tax=Halobellus rubicundus TaxID=2996466 RepID=A0ABD5MF86_9EURY